MLVVLVPVLPAEMDRAAAENDVKGVHCFYLGQNYVRLQETLAWANRRGMTTPDLSRRLREACLRSKPAFVEMMGRLAESANSDLWWALPFSSKSPVLSPLFFHLSLLEMVRSHVDTEKISKLFLVVESGALASVLESLFHARHWTIRRYRGGSTGVIRRAARDLMRYLTPRLEFLKDEWTKRSILRKIRPALPLAGSRITLLRTWFLPDSALDGNFKDVYFDNLAEFLQQRGKQPLTLFCLYRAADAGRLKAVLERTGGGIAMEQVVNGWDIVRIFLRTLRPISFRFRAEFMGTDVTPLVDSEIQQTRYHVAVALPLLHRILTRRLKQRGVEVEAVYMPYENQPWEKWFCRALKDFYPGTWVGGYQHAAVPDLHLAYAASSTELRLAPRPDTILCNGRAYADHFRKVGYPDVRVVRPLRYAWLDRRLRAGRSPAAASYDFLVCAPGFYAQTLEMLHRLILLFAGRALRVGIKLHPVIDWATVKKELSAIGVAIPPEWEVVAGQMDDVLARSAAVIWTSTSAYLDALALGIPVLHLVTAHTLDLDWIDLPEGCLHVFPEDSYETVAAGLVKLRGRIRGGAVRAFVDDRLAFDTPMESFLPPGR